MIMGDANSPRKSQKSDSMIPASQRKSLNKTMMVQIRLKKVLAATPQAKQSLAWAAALCGCCRDTESLYSAKQFLF